MQLVKERKNRWNKFICILSFAYMKNLILFVRVLEISCTFFGGGIWELG